MRVHVCARVCVCVCVCVCPCNIMYMYLYDCVHCIDLIRQTLGCLYKKKFQGHYASSHTTIACDEGAELINNKVIFEHAKTKSIVR